MTGSPLISHVSGWSGSVRGRLVRGVSANLFGQAVTIAIQLVSLPLLIRVWGVEVYGLWLVISAIPAYLAFLDAGFGTAAGNHMVAQVVKANAGAAAHVYNALNLLVLAVVVGLGAPIVIGALWFPWTAVFDLPAASGRFDVAVAAVAAYGLVCLLMSVAQAGFRADGSYAFGAALSHALRLIESAAMLSVAVMGHGLAAAAVTLLIVRIAGTVATVVTMHRTVPWLAFNRRDAAWPELRRLMRPAFAVMLFPAAFAISLQGMTLLIAALVSVKAVVVFTAIRTLTRIGLQTVAVVTQAVMPEYTAAAQGDHARLARLVAFNTTAALGIALVLAAGLCAAGGWFIGVWSGGQVDAPLGLVGLMAAVMVVQAVATVPLNLLISVNRHANCGIVMVAGALVALAGAALLLPQWGLDGAAAMLLATDIVMLAIFADRAARSGLLDAGGLRNQWRAGLTLFK